MDRPQVLDWLQEGQTGAWAWSYLASQNRDLSALARPSATSTQSVVTWAGAPPSDKRCARWPGRLAARQSPCRPRRTTGAISESTSTFLTERSWRVVPRSGREVRRRSERRERRLPASPLPLQFLGAAALRRRRTWCVRATCRITLSASSVRRGSGHCPRAQLRLKRGRMSSWRMPASLLSSALPSSALVPRPSLNTTCRLRGRGEQERGAGGGAGPGQPAPGLSACAGRCIAAAGALPSAAAQPCCCTARAWWVAADGAADQGA